jgi:hypothetical protein
MCETIGTSGPAAAAESLTDVYTRSWTIDEMIKNPRTLVMIGLPQIDFGSDIVARSAAVLEAIEQAPEESLIAV